VGVEERIEGTQARDELRCFRLSIDELTDISAGLSVISSVNFGVDQLDLVWRQHFYALATTSDWRRRSRAVKSLDLTVLTGMPSTSEISS